MLCCNSSVLLQRLGQQRRAGESTQSLEIPITDGPDVGEGHIDGYGCFSGLSFDATKRDDILARGDELLGDEMNVQRAIEACKKSLQHILQTLEMAAADRHPFRHIVDDVRRLETARSDSRFPGMVAS